MRRFASFREFYPFYLDEHANRTSRRLHFIGSCGALALVAFAIATRNAWWLLAALAWLAVVFVAQADVERVLERMREALGVKKKRRRIVRPGPPRK